MKSISRSFACSKPRTSDLPQQDDLIVWARGFAAGPARTEVDRRHREIVHGLLAEATR